jgi:flagellar biosynthesis/type III secretory pathway protein FliH
VLDLVQKKGLHLGKMRIILNFVFDFMLLPDKMDEELKLDIPFFTSSKSEKNMVLTKNFIDIRNASSLNDTGLTFEEFFYVKNQEVAAAKAAAEKAIKEAKAEAIKEAKAIKEAEAEAIKEAKAEAKAEAIKEAKAEAETKAIKSIHEMIKEGFSFEKIAGLLGLGVDYVKQLAKVS